MNKQLIAVLILIALIPLIRAVPGSRLEPDTQVAAGAAATQVSSNAANVKPAAVTSVEKTTLVQPISEAVQFPAPKEDFQDISDRKDVQWLFSMDERQRNFLLNQLHLPEPRYQQIQLKQIEFYDQIKHAQEFADAMGLNADDVERELIQEHITWMENQIGAGNYALLQNLSLW